MNVLKFPAHYYSPDASEGEYYDFYRKDIACELEGHPLELVADVSRRLHKGTSQVFRAILQSKPEDSTLEVVCKLVYGNRQIRRLQTEADYYCNELKRAQGEYVPIFRGFYEGETDQGLTACLVLDYCGEPLRTCLWALKSTKK